MSQPDFEPLASEALSAFSEISDKAEQKLNTPIAAAGDSFAAGNSLTGGQAFQNFETISKSNSDGWRSLIEVPAIARLIVEDEDGQCRVYYISRRTNLPLSGDSLLASYSSPIGKLAALPVGKKGAVTIQGVQKNFYLLEKMSFHPLKSKVSGEWDSFNNEYRHETLGVFSIESLRGLLAADGVDAGDELDRLLGQEAAASGVIQGIAHQLRTAMGLRDQPILDQFQDDIFRLPLDNQLMILGPPGTGKTTTLIKRLGQKIDRTNLDEHERKLAEVGGKDLPYEKSWLMFTPSDLLKQYLKEAFSCEQIPAPDDRIKTWESYRDDIARNSLGILKTSNGGKFTLKSNIDIPSPAVLEDPRLWYEAFQQFHEQRLQAQLRDGADIATAAATDTQRALTGELVVWADKLAGRPLVDSYRDLHTLETAIKVELEAVKGGADILLKRERNRIFNQDRGVFPQLAQFLSTLQQDEDDVDDDAEFDDDEAEEVEGLTHTDIQKAVTAFLTCLRTLSRHKYSKRSLPKNGRAAKIRDWLGDRVPADAVLQDIGQAISFQNGLRRFVNASKRYALDVPSSYRLFRKAQAGNADFYPPNPISPSLLCGTELDAVVLLIFRNARELLSQGFIARELDATRYDSLRNLASLFRHQIMVDEATDFSVLQLACMESLTGLKTRSFFACGDFNQRITLTGVRSLDQLSWVSSAIKVKNINIVYRQSRVLNAFAASLLALMGGDQSSLGVLPEHSTHDGVPLVLFEGASDIHTAAQWVAERIFEVESTVKTLPTIAVLVNNESEVKPMAHELTMLLEKINLKAVPCEQGKALGEGTDVRVFDIQHIKGLEFEAVFFVGVDKLAENKPELFDRYLYVGTTRAATYLGVACYGELPSKIASLRGEFVEKW